VSEGASFSTKLAGGLALLVGTLSVVATLNLGRVAAITRRGDVAAANRLEALLLAERLRNSVDQTVSASRGFLLSQNLGFGRRLRESQANVDQILAMFANRMKSPEGGGLVQQMREANSAYRTMLGTLLERKARGAEPAAVDGIFEQDLVPRQRHLAGMLDELVKREERRFQEGQQKRADERAHALLVAVGTLAFGVLASSVLAVVLGRHLTKLYRRERAAMQRAQHATAAREELLTIVAHDLRSPLNAIGLRASALLQTSPDDVVRREAEAIAAIVTRTSQLLGSLLDVALIDSDRLPLKKASFDVRTLLAEAVTVNSSLAAAKQIGLAVNVGPVDRILSGDHQRLGQVLHNLIENAIRFSPTGERVLISANAEGTVVHFTVKDSGPGVSPDHLPRIFERYWQAQRGSKAGVGLGLYIARGVVEAHGGRIWAENDGGAVFHFTLPANGVEAAIARVPAAQGAAHQLDSAGSATTGTSASTLPAPASRS
jgi:signal transduction histidine kinase